MIVGQLIESSQGDFDGFFKIYWNRAQISGTAKLLIHVIDAANHDYKIGYDSIHQKLKSLVDESIDEIETNFKDSFYQKV